MYILYIFYSSRSSDGPMGHSLPWNPRIAGSSKAAPGPSLSAQLMWPGWPVREDRGDFRICGDRSNIY